MGKKTVRKEELNGDGTVIIKSIGCSDAERHLVGVCVGAASVLNQNKVRMHLQECGACRRLYRPELLEESPSWLKSMFERPEGREVQL